MFVTENPTAVILDLEYNNALRGSNGKIYLSVCAILLTDVEVMVDCTLVNATLVKQLRDEIPL